MEHTPATISVTPDMFTTDDGRQFYVTYDDCAEDPRTWDEDTAVIVLRGGSYNIPDWGNSEIEEAARAIWDYSKDSDAVSTAINSVPGWIAHTTIIHGYSQSDWAEVIALAEDADSLETRSKLRNRINVFRQWKYGDVYVVNEIGGDCMGGIYADDMEDAVCSYIDGN